MKMVPIRSIADVTAGQGAPKPDEFSDSGIPFVRAGSLEGLLAGKSETDLELVPTETAMKRKLKLYSKGSILFAKSGMSATKNRIYVLQNHAYVVSHLAILKTKDNINRDYLRLALKQFPPSSLIKDLAYPAIGLGEIQGYEIPVPEEIDDQKRIAHLLGKVEALIARRKQHMQQLDELLKSVFLEMFGDPVRNEKGWEIKSLSKLIDDLPNNGLYKPQSYYGTGTKIIRIDSFYDGFVQGIENLKLVGVSSDEYKKYRVLADDILINRVNSIEYLGKLGIVPEISEPIIYESNIMRFRINKEKILPVFLLFVWKQPFIKSQIVSRAKKAVNQASINQKDVLSFLVPKPPIHLQNQFAAIVEKVESIKSRYRQSLSDLEALYGALSQKAFKGELDLSRVPLPKEDAVMLQSEQPENEKVCSFDSNLDISFNDNYDVSNQDEIIDSNTLNIFIDRAQHDPNYMVRLKTLQELDRNWKDDPNILEVFKNRAKCDDNNIVRQMALQELDKRWNDDLNILEIFKDRAQYDANYVVRLMALQKLADSWKDVPDTVTIIKDRVKNDHNSIVRLTALRELFNNWQGDPDTVNILEDRALYDANRNVRQQAVEALAQFWKDGHGVLGFGGEVPRVNKDRLIHWLRIWIDQLGNSPFLAQEFMDAALQRLEALIQEDVPEWGTEWGTEEYDEIKIWIFKALDDGRLIQTFDDANNIIQIKAIQD